MDPEITENNNTEDTLITSDALISETIQEQSSSDAIIDKQITQSENQQELVNDKEDVLKNYFKQTDGSAQITETPISTPDFTESNAKQPSTPPSATPTPISKASPVDPYTIEQKKAKKKLIIKYIIVFFNFGLTAFLVYYYLYMSK